MLRSFLLLVLGSLLAACGGEGLVAGSEDVGNVDDGGVCNVVPLATVPGWRNQTVISLGRYADSPESSAIVYIDGSPIPYGCWAFDSVRCETGACGSALRVLPVAFADANDHVVSVSFGCTNVIVPNGHPTNGATCGL